MHGPLSRRRVSRRCARWLCTRSSNVHANYAWLIQDCTKRRDLAKGKRVHEQVIQNGCDQNRVLANHIITMYGKCGHVQAAQEAFDKMVDRNVVSWTVLAAAYAQGGHHEEAFLVFRKMQLEGVEANHVSYLTVLGACTGVLDGKLLHSQVAAAGLDSELMISNALIDMYGRCGSSQDAFSVFESMPERSAVSWNSMIGAFVENKLDDMAQKLFREMQLEGFRADRASLVSVLDACTRPQSLEVGSFAHFCAAESGLVSEVSVSNALVTMYARCGSLVNAVNTFEQLPVANVISWTAIISAYAMYRKTEEAMKLLQWMMLDGTKPNNVTFIGLLNGLETPDVLPKARVLHQLIVESGYEYVSSIANCLSSVYSKCGSLDEASEVLQKCSQLTVVSWTAMVAARVRLGRFDDAFGLLWYMLHEGTKPNNVTLITLLSACEAPSALPQGKLLHSFAASTGLETDIVVVTALIDMYGKCGSLEGAQKLFNSMQRHADVVLWTAMISASVQHGEQISRTLLRKMQLEGVQANDVTYASVLSGTTELLDGKQLHAQISESGFRSELVVAALLNMYAKCGSLEDACIVFQELHLWDLIIWTSMLAAYVHHGQNREAIKIFQLMLHEGGKPSSVTFMTALPAYTELDQVRQVHGWIAELGLLEAEMLLGNCLIDVYAKCGSMKDAEAVFNRMQSRGDGTWTSLITAYSQQGIHSSALELYHKMQQDGVRASKISMIVALSCCASLAAASTGRRIHEQVVESGLEADLAVGNTLTNLYGKCGLVESCRQVFRRMQVRDQVSWNTLIAAFCQQGQGEDALRLFRAMQQDGVKPDEVTFISVLTSCNYAGHFDEGCRIFSAMEAEYRVEPGTGHLACIVDLLGRAGQVKEAWNLLDKTAWLPHAVTWRSLLSSCKSQGDDKRGKLAADQVLHLEPRDSAAYVVLSNTLAGGGKELSF